MLFDELEKAFSHIALAETKIENLVHLESGIISISASDTICNYYLVIHPQLLKTFSIGLPFANSSTSLSSQRIFCKHIGDVGSTDYENELCYLKSQS